MGHHVEEHHVEDLPSVLDRRSFGVVSSYGGVVRPSVYVESSVGHPSASVAYVGEDHQEVAVDLVMVKSV